MKHTVSLKFHKALTLSSSYIMNLRKCANNLRSFIQWHLCRRLKLTIVSLQIRFTTKQTAVPKVIYHNSKPNLMWLWYTHRKENNFQDCNILHSSQLTVFISRADSKNQYYSTALLTMPRKWTALVGIPFLLLATDSGTPFQQMLAQHSLCWTTELN